MHFPESLSHVPGIFIFYLNIANYESNFGHFNNDSLQFKLGVPNNKMLHCFYCSLDHEIESYKDL